MDRPQEKRPRRAKARRGELRRRKPSRRKPNRLALTIAVLALSVAALIWLREWMEPSLSRNRIRTARVEVGAVEGTVAGSGIVVSATEQVGASYVPVLVAPVLGEPMHQDRLGSPLPTQ